MEKRNETIKNWFSVIGYLLMFAGAIMMFFRMFVVVEDEIYIDILRQIPIMVYRSTALGLFALGFISHLISKEYK